MKKYLLLLLLFIPSIAFGMGYTRYDSTATYNGQQYYLYDLPPRYVGGDPNGNFVRMIIYNGVGAYETYKDKWFANNTWVGDTFKNNLLVNNQNLFTLVSNEFNYNLYGNFAWTNGNQRYMALQFSAGYPTTTTDDQFYNPTTNKQDGFYSFDFDIYLKTDTTDITWNNQVGYNNQGYQCHNVNGMTIEGNPVESSCWVDRYKGTFYQMGTTTYYKTTYHVDHGKFMPMSYVDSLPSFLQGNFQQDNNIYSNEYTYFMDQPFMTNYLNETQYLANFKFWVSTPYNIKYWSTEQQIFINGDRIRNTDSYNYDIKCSDESCQDYQEASILERIFNIKTFNDHGFARILDTIMSFFEMFIQSGTCSSLNFPVNIRGTNINFTLPSGCTFWNRNDNFFRSTYELIINGLITYFVFMKIYHELLRIANPDWLPTNKELMKL